MKFFTIRAVRRTAHAAGRMLAALTDAAAKLEGAAYDLRFKASIAEVKAGTKVLQERVNKANREAWAYEYNASAYRAWADHLADKLDADIEALRDKAHG